MNRKAVLPLVLLVGVIVALAFYFSSATDKKSKFNWTRTLDISQDEPYDLSLFRGALKETMGDKFHEIQKGTGVKSAWNEMQGYVHPGIYFFVGNEIFLSQGDIDLIAQHVKNGGVAFISASAIPDELFQKFPGLANKYMNTVYRDTLKVRFHHQSLGKDSFLFTNRVKDHTESSYWQYFSTRSMEIAEPEEAQMHEAHSAFQLVNLSAMEAHYTDFVYTSMGEGKLFLHANPVFFSNLYLKDSQGRKYLSNVLKHLPERDLWMDLDAYIPKLNTIKGHTRRSVFSFFEQNRPLKYAWWILLGGLVAFLFMGSRRKQRSIPIIKQPDNNALGLVDSLGYFYFTENKNALVFKREWNQFLNFLRLHLHVNPENMDEKTRERIAEKARVSRQTVDDIYEMHRKYSIFTELSGEELMETNRMITKFYLEYHSKNGK